MSIIPILTPNEEMERRAAVFNQYMLSDEMKERRLQRLKLNDAGANNAEARIMLWNMCARPDNPAEGCIFFIENFGWTFDPRKETKHIPFFLFEYQKEAIRYFIDHIDGNKDFLIEKSRDMGVTWLAVWIFIWYWLFSDGVNFLVGSYKEKLVDDRTDDSIFGRVDYGLDSLPNWVVPKGFNKKKHRTKLRLHNPVNGNLIAGDTMNPDFGRGSRKSAIFFDELGSWDYAKDAWESCGDVTGCRIGNSTPKGYNFYAKLRESGIDVLTLIWNRHPFKDQQWYQFEVSRRSPEEVAQEIDISYQKSQEGVVYPEWNENNVIQGEYDYDPGLPLYVGWDFGKTDDTAIIWTQPFDGRLRVLDTYSRSGKNIDFFVPFITGMAPSDTYKYSKSEHELIQSHSNWKRGVHFGDPAGRFKNGVTDSTVLSVLRDHGIVVNYKDSWKEHQNRKRAAKGLIQDGILLNRNDRTDEFNMAMLNASYPTPTVEGEKVVRSVKPKHDWTCIAKGQRVRTANGWYKIEDLVGTTPVVWGSKDGRLVPTKATKVWKTHDNAKLVEVKTNHRSVKCTPEHRFLLRDGTYKEAQTLKPGDKLVPFREHPNRDYTRIILNDGSAGDEHVLMQNKFNGSVPFGWTVHHINGEKRDNRPENLEPISRGYHCKITKPQRGWGSDKKHLVATPVEFPTADRYDTYEVVSVKDIGYGEVYDIEVPETNNFVVEGLVVHNSHYRSSFEYLALGLAEYVHRSSRPKDMFQAKFNSTRRALKY